MCSSIALLKVTILPFIISQSLKKWFQHILNVSVRVHSFVVNSGPVIDVALRALHTQSLCHVVESGERHGDLCYSRFVCFEDLHNRLSESVHC